MIIYPDWKLPFTFHNDDYDKQLGAVISQNNKPIDFFHKYLKCGKPSVRIEPCD